MTTLAMTALQPHPAVHPGALLTPMAASPLHRETEIIGCPCVIAGAPAEAVLRITPKVSATVRYQITGTRIHGAVILRWHGRMHEVSFDVDGAPIVRRLAALGLRKHATDQIGLRLSLKGAFRAITAPVRAVVETAKATVESAKQIAQGLPPRAATNLIRRAMATGVAQIRTAKSIWKRAGAFVARAAKNQVLQTLKQVAKSPITKVALTGVAIAFPAVGAPALAALAAANVAIAAAENAEAAAKALKGAHDTAARLVSQVKQAVTPAARAQAQAELTRVQAVIRRDEPKVRAIMTKAAAARSGMQQLAQEARRGDRMALLQLRIAKTTQAAHARARALAISAALRTHQPRTAAERARVIARALERYVPIAATELGRYHPRLAHLRLLASKAPAKAPAKARPKTSTKAPPRAQQARR
jgi:hypothetical protein